MALGYIRRASILLGIGFGRVLEHSQRVRKSLKKIGLEEEVRRG